ncbi:MAG: 3D domain-containing protein [Candidatus Spechtbacteria bacterium]|nr:3D domain-containing protein [Candidatus Spechtbacteria bacterium]
MDFILSMINLLSIGRKSIFSIVASSPYGALAVLILVIFAFPQYSLGKTLTSSDEVLNGTWSVSPYAVASTLSTGSTPSINSPQSNSGQAPQPSLSQYVVINSTSIKSSSHPTSASTRKPTAKRMWLVATAYSSTPDQTDSTPFITANGTYVHNGIIAANFLRFGTRVRIPTIYGDRIFTVEDRMNARYSYRIDIWMQTREEAIQFGSRIIPIEIVSES